MNQFMQVETKEIVRILSDEGNFFTLNNGMKIDKQLFSQKYAAMNSNQSMDAESFLNQRTSIQVNPKKQSQPLNESISINSGSINTVDPIDFLNSTGTLSSVQGLDALTKIDTSKYIDVPESQRVVVRDLSSQEQQNRGAQVTNINDEKQALLEKYKNLGTNVKSNFVDENDDKAVNQLIKSMEKPEPKIILNENGLTESQEMFRQQQIELIGKDPYEDKIRKYRATKGYQTIEPSKNPKIVIEQPEEDLPNITQSPNVTQVNNTQQSIQQVKQEDPTIAIFKKFKRNHNVSIKLEIKDKISKPDFIKVMADGFEGDIVQFYADEIFKTFLEDFKGIKKEIYNQLYKNVYGCLPDEKTEEKEDTIILIPGKPTKSGKLTFKYINEKGKIIDMIPETAESKGYKPAKNN